MTKRFGILAVFAASYACGLLTNLDGLGAGDAGPDASDAAVDAPPHGDASGKDTGADAGCPSAIAPMILVDAYCVDATKVTNAQYAQFVAAMGSNTSGQPTYCAWNTSFAPCAELAGGDNAPVTCVDWCDAYAFCSWAGKRLCGKIGGGPSAPATLALAAVDQWYRACSNGGTQALPYGNAYIAGACNDLSRDAGMPIDVATLSTCQGGYPGLFDMMGNAVEWVDSCSAATGASDTCYIRSTAFDDTGGDCTSATTQTRNSVDNTKGFRCCAY